MSIKANHALLCAMNVSHPEIDRTLASGALPGATKITGAGGGGCTISLMSSADDYHKARTSGLNVTKVSLGGDGVRIESLS